MTEAESDGDIVIQMPFDIHVDQGQVEALLAGLGGTAQLDVFLRDFAKSKGFQRLGKNVRKSLEAELDMLSRKGKILIRGGVIQLV